MFVNHFFVYFSTGGILGFSTSYGTVQRWVLSGHIAAKIRSNVEEDIGIRKMTSKPKQLQQQRIRYDEEAVTNCYKLLLDWTPIFTGSDRIVALSSGINASEDVQRDLLRAATIGKEKAQEFIERRIKNHDIGFYETIKKNKLKTFTTMNAAKTLFVHGKEVIIRADRSLSLWQVTCH
jgi:hypothetical protein